MTDRDLRKAQRAGDANRARVHRYRAGLPWPLRVLGEEGECPESRQPGWCAPTSSGEHACTRCKGTGKATPCHVTTWEGPSREVVRTLAYVGGGWAREVLGIPGDDAWWLTLPGEHGHPDDWLTGLLRLCSALPPLRVEIPCPSLHDHSSEYACDCSGTRILDVPAERYVSVLAAWAAAVGALPVWEEEWRQRCNPEGPDPCPPPDAFCPDRCLAPRRALAAARSWLACPCPQRASAWIAAASVPLAGRLPWLPVPWWTRYYLSWDDQGRHVPTTVGSLIPASACLTSPETVRTAVSTAWREVAGG